MLRVARDVARETPNDMRVLQTLAIPADNSPGLSASAKQNPAVALFRYRGVQVAGITLASEKFPNSGRPSGFFLQRLGSVMEPNKLNEVGSFMANIDKE